MRRRRTCSGERDCASPCSKLDTSPPARPATRPRSSPPDTGSSTPAWSTTSASRQPRHYARSNQEAIERVAGIVDEHGIECDFERASNYVYVESAAFAAEIEREVAAARAAGLAAERTNETDLPYRVATAIRLDDQAQFHPWSYVSALARLVAAAGGHVHERTRALRVRSGEPCVVETASGRVRAGHVVVATQLPFLDRGLFFAKAHPVKSYAVAATVAETEAPRGMYISVDEPKRSVRSTPAGGGRRVLIVGGEGGRLGEGPDGASATPGWSASCRNGSAPRPSTAGRPTTTSRSTGCPTSAGSCPATAGSSSRPASRSGG